MPAVAAQMAELRDDVSTDTHAAYLKHALFRMRAAHIAHTGQASSVSRRARQQPVVQHADLACVRPGCKVSHAERRRALWAVARAVPVYRTDTTCYLQPAACVASCARSGRATLCVG